MRIAVVGPFSARENEAVGGVEAVTAVLAEHLAVLHNEVFAVTLDRRVKQVETIKRGSVDVVRIPRFGRAELGTRFIVDRGRV